MKFITEMEVLLQIINNSLEVSSKEFSIPMMINLARKHKLMHALSSYADRNTELFNIDQLSEIDAYTRKVAIRSLRQLSEIKKVTSKIIAKDIQTIVIKGPQLSRMIYGKEAMKESVDLDLMLVNGNDLEVVHTLLTDAGYTRSNLNDYPGNFRRKLFLIAKREVSYYNPGNRIAIDLHIRPGANTYLTEHRFSNFFQHLQQYDLEGTSVTILSDEAYFVYLCYHGALHQFGRLAWLADIRAFLKLKASSMDLNQINTIAARWKVKHCVNLALMLIRDYFDEEYISIPLRASWRMNYLATSCKKVLYHKPGYGTTIPGRVNKTIYIQFLLEGFAARIDWFFGIIMRKLVPLLAKRFG